MTRRLQRNARIAALCLSAVLLRGGIARAQETCETTVLTLAEAAELLRVDTAELERLAEANGIPARRIGFSWRFDCAALIAWLRGEAPPATGSVLASPDPGAVAAAGLEGGRSISPAAVQEEPIGEAPDERVAEDVFLRGQRVLLAPGEVVVDFGQFYARSDAQDLVPVGTAASLATIEQEAFTTLLVGRVGIFNETEVFASTSFHSRQAQQFLGSTRLAAESDSEFGGVRLGVRRTLLREGAGRPDVIITVDGQLPTDNRPSEVGGGLVLVKSVDPVVLFANGNYHRTFARNTPSPASREPGDRVDVSIGYGLALNDTLALSMSISGLFAGNATFSDTSLRQPDSFSGSFGLTSWLAEGLYIEPSVSFGLTGPGNSFAVGLTVPYAF